ncbi:MAG: sulfurtransferase TusA family protein [Nitrospirae bacterium]|nr:sulfurtransferase TusA family protein [Nitrospirota bacterium]MBI3595497.1 sulfurtransferase TusA family protein [Nitrospirota bacterium]
MNKPQISKADKELDLTGDVCPITFVKSKLMLEKMNTGEILKVTLDYAPSAVNVPKSLEHDGHQVLRVDEVGNELWEVLVRKV